MSQPTALQNGSILLAEPFMMESVFRRAAILLCEHNEEGSLGFILNKSLDMRVDELIADFPEFNSTVYYGGPVQTDTIHFLHTVGDLLENSQAILPGVYWGGSFDQLKFLIQSKLVKPEQIRFYIGYSGWTDGQLSDELLCGSWVLANGDANYVFKANPRLLWKQVMQHKGELFGVIAQMPDYPNWN